MSHLSQPCERCKMWCGVSSVIVFYEITISFRSKQFVRANLNGADLNRADLNRANLLEQKEGDGAPSPFMPLRFSLKGLANRRVDYERVGVANEKEPRICTEC